MTSQSGRSEILQPDAKPIQPRAENPPANYEANHDEIRRRAYEIYLEGGSLPGRELDDWLRAERELRKVALFTHDWNRLQQHRAANLETEIAVERAESMGVEAIGRRNQCRS